MNELKHHHLVPDTQLLIWQMVCPQSLPIRATRMNEYSYSAGEASSIPSLSYLRGLSTLQPHVIISFSGILVCLFLPQATALTPTLMILVMLIGPSEHEVATALDLLVTFLPARGWEINPRKTGVGGGFYLSEIPKTRGWGTLSNPFQCGG